MISDSVDAKYFAYGVSDPGGSRVCQFEIFDKWRGTIVPAGVRLEIGEHSNANGHQITPVEDTSDSEFIVQKNIHRSPVETGKGCD